MPSKMRVLLLPLHRWVSSRWGSELAWAFNIADTLGSCSELEVTVLVGNIDSEDKQRLERHLRVVSLGLGRLDSTSWTSKLNHARFYFGLAQRGMQLVRDYRPDVIHHVFPIGLGYGLNPQFLMTKNGPPRVVGPLLYPPFNEESSSALSPAGIPFSGSAMPSLQPLFRRLHNSTLSRARWLFFDSPETRNLTTRSMPLATSIAWSLLATGGYDPVDVGHSNPTSELRVGVLHYLRPRKRLDLLLRSIAQSKVKVSISIGGTGPDETRLEDLSKTLGLEDKVRFLGRISPPNRINFWESVDLVVTLDKFPPLALSTIQEAMLAGRPFIASGLGNSPYSKLPYGIVLGPDIIGDLSEALLELDLNRERVAAMGSEARKFALQQFTKESVKRTLLHAYNNVIGSFRA